MSQWHDDQHSEHWSLQCPVSLPVVREEDEAVGTVTGVGGIVGETQVGAAAVHQATAMPLRVQQAGLAGGVQAWGRRAKAKVRKGQ